MTLLANEATEDSRRLLQKYNQPDAVSYVDLETKLANLYFKTDDKLQLEKEMAQIHPHKKWLLESLPPQVEVKKEEVLFEIKPETKPVVEEKKEEKKEEVVEKTSNFVSQGCSTCNCPACTNAMQGFVGRRYNFEGEQNNTPPYQYTTKDTMAFVAVIAIAGMFLYTMSRNR